MLQIPHSSRFVRGQLALWVQSNVGIELRQDDFLGCDEYKSEILLGRHPFLLRSVPQFEVAAEQIVRRTIMFEFRLGPALKLGNDALGQDLAQFNAPLIERINVPY